MTKPTSDQMDEPPITSIQAISTGAGEVHKEHREGSWMPRLLWVFASRSWVKIPVNCFVIQHRKGLVLFDTGADPALVADPNYIASPIGRFLLPWIFRFHIEARDGLDEKLRAIGLSASDIHTAVISHLHFDHVGGVKQIPQAELLVSRREWEQLAEPHPEREWILRDHIELPGAKWRPIDFSATQDPLFARFGGSYDVFGDGSMVLLPTPGHTPGSLSMLVRSAGWPPLLLVGDLTYATEFLMRDQLPGTGDAQQLRASYAKVRALKEDLPDLVILPAHDLETAGALQRAVACAE